MTSLFKSLIKTEQKRCARCITFIPKDRDLCFTHAKELVRNIAKSHFRKLDSMNQRDILYFFDSIKRK